MMASSLTQRTKGGTTVNLTSNEVAERLRVSKRTVDNWRQTGQGPRWLKVGGHRVIYPLTEVEAYETACLVGAAA